MSQQLFEIGRLLKARIADALKEKGNVYLRCKKCHWVGPATSLVMPRGFVSEVAAKAEGKAHLACPQCRHQTFQELRHPKVTQSELPGFTRWGAV